SWHYCCSSFSVKRSANNAALKLQEDESFTNKNIVVILPSSGERYLSTALFADLFTEKELQQ
ncbi:hypothetical protein ACUOA5_22185, partial [Escherichia coli]